MARAALRHTEIVRAADGEVLACARTPRCPISRASGKITRVSHEIHSRLSVSGRAD